MQCDALSLLSLTSENLGRGGHAQLTSLILVTKQRRASLLCHLEPPAPNLGFDGM